MGYMVGILKKIGVDWTRLTKRSYFDRNGGILPGGHAVGINHSSHSSMKHMRSDDHISNGNGNRSHMNNDERYIQNKRPRYDSNNHNTRFDSSSSSPRYIQHSGGWSNTNTNTNTNSNTNYNKGYNNQNMMDLLNFGHKGDGPLTLSTRGLSSASNNNSNNNSGGMGGSTGSRGRQSGRGRGYDNYSSDSRGGYQPPLNQSQYGPSTDNQYQTFNPSANPNPSDNYQGSMTNPPPTAMSPQSRGQTQYSPFD